VRLVIGNRNYSSWSLRAWLYLRESGLDFEEIRIPLFEEGSKRRLLQYSPSGRVPVLIDGDETVWDSLAIMEWLSESRPGALQWPRDSGARALARSVSAEMHSGFLAIRDELPQNLRRRRRLDPASLSPAARRQIERVEEIWASCRERYGSGGRWLCGELSIVDVVYAPVALRFRTYEIEMSRIGHDYLASVLSLASVQEWLLAAAAEPESLDFVDRLVPAAQSPLELG
jgi:glutathione S-transferase